MSKYTVTIDQLVNSGFDFGLTEYPIFDETYRIPLNKKIIEHYRFREIGFETPAMFRFFLNRTLNEIMPYYNDLWETTLLDFDPLTNYNMVEKIVFTGNEDTDSTEHGSGNNSGKQETESENNTQGRTNVENSYSKNSRTDVNMAKSQTGSDSVTHTGEDYTEEDNRIDHLGTNYTLFSDTPQDTAVDPFATYNYLTNATAYEFNTYDSEHKENTVRRGTTDTNTYGNSVNDSGYNTVSDSGSESSDSTVNSTVTNKDQIETTNEYINDLANKILKVIENETNSQKKGYQGITPMELIQQMRDLILNIELMIIDDLQNLFMQIY